MADRDSTREAGKAAEVTAAQAGMADRQITELTGKDPEAVIGVEPTEDGWLVTVDVVEVRRIPSATDVIATYEVKLAADGDLISYRRVKRYGRGHGSRED